MVEDITGQRFGKLSVLQRIQNNKKQQACWLCQCDCGNLKEATTTLLNSGKTRSCGCLRKDVRSLPAGKSSFNYLLNAYERGARNRGIKWELSDKDADLLFQGDCFYCGQVPSNIIDYQNRNGSYTYNGIDRVDNSGDYIISNCVSCCKKCNFMKQKLEQHEFLSQIANIYHNYFEV